MKYINKFFSSLMSGFVWLFRDILWQGLCVLVIWGSIKAIFMTITWPFRYVFRGCFNLLDYGCWSVDRDDDRLKKRGSVPDMPNPRPPPTPRVKPPAREDRVMPMLYQIRNMLITLVEVHCYDYEAAMRALRGENEIKIIINKGGKNINFTILEYKETTADLNTGQMEWVTIGIGATLKTALRYAANIKTNVSHIAEEPG